MSDITLLSMDDERVSYGDVLHICRNLRFRDHEEIFATRHDDNPDQLAEDVWLLRGCAWVVFKGDDPVAVIGARLVHPTMWTIFAFGTASWKRCIITLTRHAEKFLKPMFRGAKATRVQAHAMATHDDARRWLGFCGMHQEATLKSYGKAGQDFVVYVWHPT